jgi:hypothetical protein
MNCARDFINILTTRASDINAPPVLGGEVFCKMNTQERLVTSLESVEADGPQRQCNAQTEATLEWAKSQLSPMKRWRANRWNVEYINDILFPSGPDVLFDENAYVHMEPSLSARKFSIQAPSLFVGNDPIVDGHAAGLNYCKSFAYDQALLTANNMASSKRLSKDTGVCIKINFSEFNLECVDYKGEGWYEAAMRADCIGELDGWWFNGTCPTTRAQGACTTGKRTVAERVSNILFGSTAAAEESCEGAWASN